MIPILSIFIRPLKTFEVLAQKDNDKNHVNLIFFFASMVAGISSINDLYLVFENYYLAVFVGLLFSGLLGVVILTTLTTFVIWGLSRLFEGKATMDQIRLVIAYSMIPNLISLIFGMSMIGLALIKSDYDLIGYKNMITTIVLWIFTIRIIITGLMYFNKYSYGYAILTIFIPPVIFTLILIMIKYLIL